MKKELEEMDGSQEREIAESDLRQTLLRNLIENARTGAPSNFMPSFPFL